MENSFVNYFVWWDLWRKCATWKSPVIYLQGVIFLERGYAFRILSDFICKECLELQHKIPSKAVVLLDETVYIQ